MNQVLVVDDDAGMRAAIEANFRHLGWEVRTAAGTGEALAQFANEPCPLVITDMRMPDGDGLRVLEGVRSMAPDTAVIFLTAYGNVPDAVVAMKEGACDYLVKPISFEQLRQASERILESSQHADAGSGNQSGIIGEGGGLRGLIQRARIVARSDVDVLIEAESGTGKELLARLIHRESNRSARPFVAVNCAALPEALLESELFGHEKGAFTGAAASKPGRFELADGGTLLLDEIGEMPRALQPKLLRVLQEREVDRLGGTRPVPVDVRVIATTHRSLRGLVEEGQFRTDLYYRLNVVPLSIPPLRERRDDIPELVAHFLHKYARPTSRSRSIEMSTGLMDRLVAHDWPGNVRELENLVRRLLTFAPSGSIGADALEGIDMDAVVDEPDGLRAGLTLKEMERQLLERTLEATDGNRTHTAEMLGVSLRTVRNKIREYELSPQR